MPRILALIVLAVIAGFLLWVALSGDSTAEPAAAAPEPAERDLTPPPVLSEHPTELVNIDGWLQSDATTLEEAMGEVTIVQFWTFGCYNCKNTIPHLREIYNEYHDQGLEIIGIHAPEFDYEKDVGNIEQSLADLDIPWQVVLDTDRANFSIWQTAGRRFWPRTFVLDGEGNIRFDKIGEGKYSDLADTVAALLNEA